MVILSSFFLFVMMLENSVLWGGTAVITPFPSKAQNNLHFRFGAQSSTANKCAYFFVLF